MLIKDVKVRNSRVGVRSGNYHEVFQLVTMQIQFFNPKMKDKEIDLGIRKRTTLSFVAETYFGTTSDKTLELWSIDGELMKTMTKPKGKIIGIHNDWFIVLQNKAIEAYNNLGEKVANGELNTGNEVSLYLLKE